MSSDEIPTPNTDEASFGTGQVSVEFARRMEREKNSLIVRLHNLCDEWSKSKCSGEYGIAMRQCAAVLYSIIQEASNE
jgi:hypothetical protein